MDPVDYDWEAGNLVIVPTWSVWEGCSVGGEGLSGVGKPEV